MVRFNGQTYYLCRLGFGLSCAPKIMTAILSKVLSIDSIIDSATDHYIDDIIVNESIVKVNEVVQHLNKHGLATKPPDGLHMARVLGLQLHKPRNKSQILWKRGNIINECSFPVSRRELFSVCGKLVGHYPIGNWLRVACSYVKRCSDGSKWTDHIGEKAELLLREVLERVEQCDPVHGIWNVSCNSLNGILWCDASSLALAAALEIDGDIVEGAAWLRKKEDSAHINVAELDAVLRGVNLALRWNVQVIHI